MFRPFFRLTAFATLLLASTLSFAQYVAPMALDRSFGGNGIAPVPQWDAGHPGMLPLGFVHMPTSGNYLYFTVQQVGDAIRIVGSKLLENGAVDTSWGTGGSRIYALPVPDGVSGGFGAVEARVAVGVENGAEIVYVVYRFSTQYLAVARFGADGTLLTFDSSNLPVHFAFGAGSISAVATGTKLYGSGAGLLVAVQGRSNDIDKTALIQVKGGTIYETFGTSFARPGLRVNRLALRSDGMADVVGTEAGLALFIAYNAYTNALGTDRYFTMPCAATASSASVADDIVRDASLGSDVLILGRASCSGGGNDVVLARVSSVESAPGVAWHLSLARDPDACGALTSHCLAALATMSNAVPGRVYAIAATGYLAQVDVAPTPRVVGLDAWFSADTLIVPSEKFGAYQGQPWLTGVAQVPGSSMWGLGRLDLDRLFSSGMD